MGASALVGADLFLHRTRSREVRVAAPTLLRSRFEECFRRPGGLAGVPVRPSRRRKVRTETPSTRASSSRLNCPDCLLARSSSNFIRLFRCIARASPMTLCSPVLGAILGPDRCLVASTGHAACCRQTRIAGLESGNTFSTSGQINRCLKCKQDEHLAILLAANVTCWFILKACGTSDPPCETRLRGIHDG